MKNKQHQELAVCGFEAVRALAEQNPGKIQRLFFSEDRSRFFGEICRRLAAEKKLYRMVEDESELEKLCGSVHHQGVVAMISFPEIPRLEFDALAAWRQAGEKVLVCDRVGNANNLGAIIRSAAFFGITKLVISEDDGQAQITTSTYRIAQGGMEFVELYRVSSAQWLAEKTAGQAVRIGTDPRARNRLSDIRKLTDGHNMILLFLGNEETGLSEPVKKSCDHLIRIAGSGNVESLNVAQSAAVFLYELSGL
ncbi:RNA methyltransferase [Brucepastera parasyntrophica]|uniref:TrmH family RNA methyltransferase n=1 Tax=Brucepastera parasyntrophica TaxID=2880008 RepID=UPI00210C7B39|nr:RNA methyltransferase [Brucepastera parasyntrophica]ULQ61195.1 RNA methyltransferase [Brucepastera parasyntrophica]